MNQSVLKALDILDLFIKQHDMTLSDISKKLDMPKPTAYRLISALESRGVLHKQKYSEHDIRYTLGLKLLELGNIVSEQLETRKIAYPHMEALCQKINEVVHLVIIDQFEGVYIEKVESNQTLRLHTRIGKRSPLHIGSGPKLLLAYQGQDFIEDYLQTSHFSNVSEPFSMAAKSEIKKEIAGILQNGYAVSYGEQDAETIGISYPVRDHTGQVCASLAVSGPTIRFFGERGQQIQEETKKTAQAISKDLGYKKREDI
ncbi:DNA-binding IclR family transcriptional regulator [Scopulibacillus daqui]|uniref:DNA-binding IclR family transcriptional regulator n=1 Tax=Scopulibacillus daqui TaxID=1469162 RepID=A0ABS2PYU8_9BACL|nr:IclR family transcriptional regulator [Scopulibacillus daqui]MBM7645224.1 DNA-binding IclR family transcriptional regulator [Scopulibacillus daqui]